MITEPFPNRLEFMALDSTQSNKPNEPNEPNNIRRHINRLMKSDLDILKKPLPLTVIKQDHYFEAHIPFVSKPFLSSRKPDIGIRSAGLLNPTAKNDYKLTSADKTTLVHPESLVSLKRDRDYVLLKHILPSTVKDRVNSEGLKSLKLLAEQENASEEIKRRYTFCAEAIKKVIVNDPELIYFQPVRDNPTPSKSCVLVAVRPHHIKVYNSIERNDGSFNSYNSSGIPILEYLNTPVQNLTDYIPEVTIRTDLIEPTWFVTPETLKNIFP